MNKPSTRDQIKLRIRSLIAGEIIGAEHFQIVSHPENGVSVSLPQETINAIYEKLIDEFGEDSLKTMLALD